MSQDCAPSFASSTSIRVQSQTSQGAMVSPPGRSSGIAPCAHWTQKRPVVSRMSSGSSGGSQYVSDHQMLKMFAWSIEKRFALKKPNSVTSALLRPLNGPPDAGCAWNSLSQWCSPFATTRACVAMSPATMARRSSSVSSSILVLVRE